MRERWVRFSDSFLKFFGLRPYQTGPRAIDPYNIYASIDNEDDKRALRVAMFVTMVFHVLIFVVRFATGQQVFVPDNKQIVTLRNIAGPPSIAGGWSPKSAPKKLEVPKPKPQPLPFPDPTPDDPEPLYQVVPDPAPEIVAQIGTELSIGEISGPPGTGGYGGTGKGPGVGSEHHPTPHPPPRSGEGEKSGCLSPPPRSGEGAGGRGFLAGPTFPSASRPFLRAGAGASGRTGAA